jgi:Na+/proline symporter
VAFVPLVFGIYWSRATTQGAVFSILLGVPIWLGAKYLKAEDSDSLWQAVPPQLYGLAASLFGIIIGSLMPPWIKHTQPDPAELAQKRGVSMGH